jgi:hypothetical protein
MPTGELSSRVGNVAQTGRPVLLANGTEGSELFREVVLEVGEPLIVQMGNTSGRSRFVLYGMRGEPTQATVTLQPFDVGLMAFPTPLSGGSPRPKVIANNLGFRSALGVPCFFSEPAPSIVLLYGAGQLRVPVTATLQGFIEDSQSGSYSGISITNAIVLKIVDL